MKRLFIMLGLVLLSGCSLRVLDPKTSTGQDQANLIYLSFGIMMVVLVVVFVLFALFVTKYRETESNQNVIPEDSAGDRRLEITWTVIPVILLTILAIPTVQITYDLASTDAESEETVHIDVVAEQFNWNFNYENGKATENEVIIPKGQEVVFHLESADVVHSFWIPQLSGKTDVIPGEELVQSFTPQETGTYQGKCAEFCGSLHAVMRFETKVVEQDEFEDWLDNE
ncbi:cytochrome c oxidase subunit II [Thalassobacillus sp. CUG 92003]|uniref:cytochrome c oxidase subunit II n=1 Tax=Thalassobacillus sp. CUG 92003 TaxID=2736641 RepID=UPI0015E78D17|nr:cytochrome c oxidase subunit II [Thalassobacillus sp. CUG 92003]